MRSFEECAGKILERQRLRQSAKRTLGKSQESFGSELLPRRRANLGCAIGERQDHVAVIQPHALLVVGFTCDISYRQAFQPLPPPQDPRFTLPPHNHPPLPPTPTIN